jgi:hypothetical protein
LFGIFSFVFGDDNELRPSDTFPIRNADSSLPLSLISLLEDSRIHITSHFDMWSGPAVAGTVSPFSSAMTAADSSPITHDIEKIAVEEYCEDSRSHS